MRRVEGSGRRLASGPSAAGSRCRLTAAGHVSGDSENSAAEWRGLHDDIVAGPGADGQLPAALGGWTCIAVGARCKGDRPARTGNPSCYLD